MAIASSIEEQLSSLEFKRKKRELKPFTDNLDQLLETGQPSLDEASYRDAFALKQKNENV